MLRQKNKLLDIQEELTFLIPLSISGSLESVYSFFFVNFLEGFSLKIFISKAIEKLNFTTN